MHPVLLGLLQLPSQAVARGALQLAQLAARCC